MLSSNRPVVRQHLRKAATGAAWAWVVPAELFHQLGVDADNSLSALDGGLARGNLLRRLLLGSKGCLGVVVAVHGGPPRWQVLS